MPMTLYLFDDGDARAWEPFSLTRPVGELLLGCSVLRARAEAVWGTECSGHLSHGTLAGFEEGGAPPVVSASSLDAADVRILLNSRVAWDIGPLPPLDRAATLMVGDRPVGWIVPPGAPTPPERALLDGTAWTGGGPEVPVPGTLIGEPWDLVAETADAIREQAEGTGLYRHTALEGVVVVGDHEVFGGRDAVVEPGVVLDLTAGPIVLEEDVKVYGPARLTGPLYVGPGSVILGGSVGTSSIGPRCKVRGEVADSVLCGFTNKAHDGYLGHALLGRWVNLGAQTTNSDLKNTYGEVRVRRSTGSVPTGRMKVGCFLGDHVRTGIGTLLTTGAVVGAGSNVFGGTVTPAYVPPFSWGSGSDLTDHRLDRFLETARTVLARRHEVLTEAMAGLFASAWHESVEVRRSFGVSTGGDPG
jgi:UDP-N-acetylglucosamine diphosphorylase/glucosamine-1-phosphate N-acetyltransferase